jgi:acyl-CoA synthetase (AMP-forming)/AMP-acid ligase II
MNSWRRGGVADFIGKARRVVEWAEESFGARLAGVYGSSECHALMATWPPGLRGSLRSIAGGELVCPETDVRVVETAGEDDEDGADDGVDDGADDGAGADGSDGGAGADGKAQVPARLCGVGQPGELQFRGKHIMKSYFHDSWVSGRAFTSDGWFRSGDRGYLSGPKSFVYLCRMGEALRLHGFLVEPREIESFLMAQAGVDGARVVGAPGADGHEIAVAFVKFSAAAEMNACDELRSLCRQQLAAYKVPARIVAVDQFPVTSGTNGEKISVMELKTRAKQIAHRGL